MKIPKKIEKLLERRTKLAQDLMYTCAELDDWLEKRGVDLTDSEINDAVMTGAMIYIEPANAERVVRDYLDYL